MRVSAVGRKRKKLEDKSSVLMIRLDNKTIFRLCEKFGIEFDSEAEILDDKVKKDLVDKIKNNLEIFIK
ncbi:MAG: hypothetical protein H9W80_12580 [Enterococcus sp.]|nr:hypothetical protein [Enterococcus sp.]